MTVAGKIWGQTELLEANGALEFHRIEFKKGYECSEHKHEFKWNGFYVEEGQMMVKVWSSQTRSVGKLSNNRKSMPFSTPNCSNNPAVDSMKKNAETNNRRFHLSS